MRKRTGLFFTYFDVMFFPARPDRLYAGSKGKPAKRPLLSPLTSRLSVIITFAVGALLLIDQQLETTFVAAPVIAVDGESHQIVTEKGSFLAAYPDNIGPSLSQGDLVVMEVSPLTKTVVAYKKYNALLVDLPRESVFSYWPITALMSLLSLFLIIRWTKIERHFELLVLNLILLVIVTILYLVSH